MSRAPDESAAREGWRAWATAVAPLDGISVSPAFSGDGDDGRRLAGVAFALPFSYKRRSMRARAVSSFRSYILFFANRRGVLFCVSLSWRTLRVGFLATRCPPLAALVVRPSRSRGR